MRPPITLRGLAEALSTLPHCLGYRPRDSLVLRLLQPGERAGSYALGTTARIDLPEQDEGIPVLIHSLMPVIDRERPEAVELFAFEDEVDATRLLLALSDRCLAGGHPVAHLARVRDGRYQVLDVDGRADPWCPVPEPEAVPATADLVLLGRGPGPDRAGYTALLRAGDESDTSDLVLEFNDLDERLARADTRRGVGLTRAVLRFVERGLAAWSEVLDVSEARTPVAELRAPVVANALFALELIPFRDGLMVWLVPGHLGPGMLPAGLMRQFSQELPVARLGDPRVLDRLVELAARVPFPLSGPLSTVLAHTAWAQNNGTLANAAIDRALQIDPVYSLARLTDQVLHHAVRPPPGPFTPAA